MKFDKVGIELRKDIVYTVIYNQNVFRRKYVYNIKFHFAQLNSNSSLARNDTIISFFILRYSRNTVVVSECWLKQHLKTLEMY